MRSELTAEPASIEPFDELEREHIADALAWIDSGAELCRITKPATPPKHLVSYFVLVDGEYVLLVDHKTGSANRVFTVVAGSSLIGAGLSMAFLRRGAE